MAKWNKGQESIIQGVYTGPDKTGDNVEMLRIALYGWDYTNSQWRRVAVDENGQLEGVGGGTTTPAVDNYLLESGDNMLLETGDLMLTE